MDFASVMSSEISKKRKTPSIANSSEPAPKFQRRSEVEAARRATYLAEQASLERQRHEREELKHREEEEDSARREAIREKQRRLAEERRQREEERLGRRKGSPETDEQLGSRIEEQIDDLDLVRELRELGEPVKLFGEAKSNVIKRLKRLRAARSRSASRELEAAMNWDEMQIRTQDNSDKVYRQLSAWFRMVLGEWHKALLERPESVALSFAGRQASSALVEARKNMEPLFLHFKEKDLRKEVFEKVVEIVVAAQNRGYVKATDIYLRLSIGNAAWPIGVTMVGIHERSAREKLHENAKDMAAHIMSDEVTRKYLQSIKRCLSFCQTRWPPDDPSDMV